MPKLFQGVHDIVKNYKRGILLFFENFPGGMFNNPLSLPSMCDPVRSLHLLSREIDRNGKKQPTKLKPSLRIIGDVTNKFQTKNLF